MTDAPFALEESTPIRGCVARSETYGYSDPLELTYCLRAETFHGNYGSRLREDAAARPWHHGANPIADDGALELTCTFQLPAAGIGPVVSHSATCRDAQHVVLDMPGARVLGGNDSSPATRRRNW